jgi:hypothetical protein
MLTRRLNRPSKAAPIQIIQNRRHTQNQSAPYIYIHMHIHILTRRLNRPSKAAPIQIIENRRPD